MRKIQFRIISKKIVYTHDGVETTLRALVGWTPFKSANQYGVWSRTTLDFIVLSEDLDFTPTTGDTILYKGKTYAVAESNNSTAWQWSDPHLWAIRIYTKMQEETSE